MEQEQFLLNLGKIEVKNRRETGLEVKYRGRT